MTTDFGLRDWFVGTMKGVIAGIAPGTTVIDITHDLAPGDIRAGAFALAAAYRYFPKGTVHLAVIDPGVGSQRKAIVVETSDYFFAAPDNGLLALALRREKVQKIRVLENTSFFLKPVSNTFHGRDIFAPVAAHLSRGIDLKDFGPKRNELVQLPGLAPRQRGNRTEGQVAYIDRFGNAITNIYAEGLGREDGAAWEVVIGRKTLCRVRHYYQSVRRNAPLGLVGSSGFLEVAINGGSAARRLGLRVGTPVAIRPARPI